MSGETRLVAEVLSDRVCALSYADLPAEVLGKARELLLDTLLGAWAGAGATGMAGVHHWLQREGGRAESTAWGFGDRLPATAATLLNALSASALDYDSLNRSVHPDCIAIAAALAVAERQHATGQQFLTAFIAGSEIICRLARASIGESKGWSHSPVYGIFGAAVAAASLLDLGPEGMVSAMGICLSQVGGTQQANVEQMLTKRLQPALAARNGVFAALAAQAGITGPHAAFEGKFGLWPMFHACDPDLFLSGFGREFVLLETGLKKYPVCACSHAAMIACDELIRAHALQADDIAEIEAIISPFMDRLVGGPFDPAANIEVTAQFSLRYALAAIIHFRRLTIDELKPAAVLDGSIGALADRVRITIDAANTNGLAPATVRLRVRSGKVLERTICEMPGTPAMPMSGQELEEKLRACANNGLRPLSDAEFGRLQDAVAAVDTFEDVGELTRLLV